MPDYVVVGAGSAGCAVARRLAERGAHVCLVEAGRSNDGITVRAPALYPLVQGTRDDWCLSTTPQEGLGGRRMPWPRGRVVGGSSSINAMIYIRGDRSNYDDWERAGCTGWGFRDVLPLFLRMEAQSRIHDEHHGRDGLVSVEDLSTPLPISTAFVEAASRYLETTPGRDFNGASQMGAGLFQRTCRSGRRESASSAYLESFTGSGKIELVPNALVTRVVLEGTRAVGVACRVNGREREVRASREVVLAAGAIGSPQLLLLSGIGPAEHLRALGIDVRVDLRGVGENLQDHLFAPVSFRCRDASSVLALGPFTVAYRVLAWWAGNTSLLATNHAEAGAFLHTLEGLRAPDLQFHLSPWGAALAKPDGTVADPPKGPHFSLLATMLYPKSRGTVRLASARPEDAPHIDAAYLREPEDLELLLRGVAIARAIARTAPLDALVEREVTPGADDRASIVAAIRASASTMFHPVGTCAMGVGDEAVCTPELRVRGVEGLRVADASIMPTIVGGNTNAPAMMIGERAADLILPAPKSARDARTSEDATAATSP